MVELLALLLTVWSVLLNYDLESLFFTVSSRAVSLSFTLSTILQSRILTYTTVANMRLEFVMYFVTLFKIIEI